jgi:LuxR family maltose regulon positive regulatory protein
VTLPDMPGALTNILHLAAVAALAVDAGDEDAATVALAEDPHALAGRADNWYWRDRSLHALPYVLLPDQREPWDEQTTHSVHRGPIELAGALVDARAGDLARAAALRWPDAGLVRTHLPVRWIAELAAAAAAAGNPPPPDLLDAGGSPMRDALSAIASDASSVVSSGAARLLADAGGAPAHVVRLAVIGALEVRVDGALVDHPDLRRRRVRELLCLLVIRRRARRAAIAEELWPESHDARHNLRVTLNYLRDVLEPTRDRHRPSLFVAAGHDTVSLHEGDALHCDLWELDAHLDAAAEAERQSDPRRALEHYMAALPLWRGDAFDELADVDWARDEQTRVRSRYSRAAVRAGDLLVAGGRWADALRAGEHATRADPLGEGGYVVQARAHLGAGDVNHARQVVEACIRALGEIDARPGTAIMGLGAEIERRT